MKTIRIGVEVKYQGRDYKVLEVNSERELVVLKGNVGRAFSVHLSEVKAK